MELIKDIEFWKLLTPFFVAAIAWLFNEYQKRALEQYSKKEAHYQELISSLRGFYIGSTSVENQTKFLEELNKCWLYCPDIVIKKAYEFLDTVRPETAGTQEKKMEAMGSLVVEIRRDLLSRRYVKNTKFTGKDFKHLRPI